jgi:hypothetical protein
MIGKNVPRYKILEKLSEGGTGGLFSSFVCDT